MTDEAKPRTLWGFPIVIVDGKALPSTAHADFRDQGPRRILSEDLIEGVCQLMDGKLTMEVTDHEGKKFKVRIELEPICHCRRNSGPPDPSICSECSLSNSSTRVLTIGGSTVEVFFLRKRNQ